MKHSYWVYLNMPNNKALIHEASCSHCNDGSGRGVAILDNGEWLGFATKEAATAFAKHSRKQTVRWCGHCARRLNIRQMA